jgi:hypothetical protein
VLLLLLLVVLWWALHGTPRHIKEAGAGRVAAAPHHAVWVSPHTVLLLLLEACAAACACWALLLLLARLIIITVTAQESQVILILALQHTAAEGQPPHPQQSRPDALSAQRQLECRWCQPCVLRVMHASNSADKPLSSACLKYATA